MSDGSGSMAGYDKEQAAARLAVEVGWKQIASSQQALEGMRGRGMALLSVMVVAASIIVGASISDRTNASGQPEPPLSSAVSSKWLGQRSRTETLLGSAPDAPTISATDH